MTFTGSPFLGDNFFLPGGGGPGGGAIATGVENPALSKAASAEATGGAGGDGGKVVLVALGKMVFEAGPLQSKWEKVELEAVLKPRAPRVETPMGTRPGTEAMPLPQAARAVGPQTWSSRRWAASLIAIS